MEADVRELDRAAERGRREDSLGALGLHGWPIKSPGDGHSVSGAAPERLPGIPQVVGADQFLSLGARDSGADERERGRAGHDPGATPEELKELTAVQASGQRAPTEATKIPAVPAHRSERHATRTDTSRAAGSRPAGP